MKIPTSEISTSNTNSRTRGGAWRRFLMTPQEIRAGRYWPIAWHNTFCHFYSSQSALSNFHSRRKWILTNQNRKDHESGIPRFILIFSYKSVEHLKPFKFQELVLVHKRSFTRLSLRSYNVDPKNKMSRLESLFCSERCMFIKKYFSYPFC